MSDQDDRLPFSEWILRPQTLIGLSALLLSMTGLFISIYETRLVYQQQRASVWPRLTVGPSISEEKMTFRVENSGIGPARVKVARMSYDGERQSDWDELIRRVGQDISERSFSLINHNVLAPESTEPILELTLDTSDVKPGHDPVLVEETLDGRVDITLCYCSVYEECWITSMQDQLGMVRRARRDSTRPSARPNIHQKVESCEGIERSGI